VVRGGIVAVADKYAYSADLLKNKSRPEAAAEGAAAWVITERTLREKLKKEREAKEREQEKEVRLRE
jgi:chaperone BCS1